MIKRRSAIEPTIGHVKTDGRLARHWLKGELGDALHAVLCRAGHTIRLLLRKLRLPFARPIAWLLAAMGRTLTPLAHVRLRAAFSGRTLHLQSLIDRLL